MISICEQATMVSTVSAHPWRAQCLAGGLTRIPLTTWALAICQSYGRLGKELPHPFKAFLKLRYLGNHSFNEQINNPVHEGTCTHDWSFSPDIYFWWYACLHLNIERPVLLITATVTIISLVSWIRLTPAPCTDDKIQQQSSSSSCSPRVGWQGLIPLPASWL